MKPTHKVCFYGARCYYDERTGELEGVNLVHDVLAMLVAFTHNSLALLFPGFGEAGFPFRVIEEYGDD